MSDGSTHLEAPSEGPHSMRALSLTLRAVIARVLREPVAHPDVEDALQESLRRVIEGKAPEGVPTHRWAIGVARHVALDVIRERQRTRARFEPMSDDSSRDVAASGLPSPVDDVLSREEQVRFSAALSHLPEGQRRAVVLFHVEGLSYEEIGARLRVPVGTVATWLMRAKSALHQALSEKKS